MSEAEELPVEGFFSYRMAVGTIKEARLNPKARKPAFHLTIDFGVFGIRDSSAQITARYTPETLVGRQVVGVMNFPARQVAGVRSEVLVLGAVNEASEVLLLRPDDRVENGAPIA